MTVVSSVSPNPPMAATSSILSLLLLLSAVDCWRPMIHRDPLRDPTYEYTPPVTLHYWNEEPPAARLTPPPPGPPLPWLATTGYAPAVYTPPSPSTDYILSSTPTTTTTTTAAPTTPSTTTAPPPAMVIQGHSKVKKYGPVEGSVNSVYLHIQKKT